MAKRGYTRDTIRGGASDWDVSRPFSSYLKLLGSLVAHPVRFFEVLPKVSDVRAPALFRYGYLVTWRIVAYPLGFYLPLTAVPVVRWLAAVYAGVVLLGIGFATVREVGAARAALVSAAITGLLSCAAYLAARL